MVNLFMPGRQIITTDFQERYLKEIFSKNISELDIFNKRKFRSDKIDKLIVAITSANQDNSRYNPLSIKERLLGVERFCVGFKSSFDIGYSIFSIPHYNNVENFPEIINKEILAQTTGGVDINPENTIVFCSTPSLIDKYRRLGFSILTGEYSVSKKKYLDDTPQKIISDIFENYKDKKNYRNLLTKLSFANISLWKDFSYIPKKIAWIWSDPLLTESGSITNTRDYSTYSVAMSNPEAIRFKYDEIKSLIKDGKIVDEGCADGSLLSLISKDFTDSDLIGIEITSEFLAMCRERMRAGAFGGNFVHFHQRNLMDKIFEDSSIDTTICNSTAHEIWSYGKGRSSLIGYLKKKYNQLRSHGRLIVRDVIGPEHSARDIYMKLNRNDGKNNVMNTKKFSNKDLSKYLSELSTYSRFLVFVNDYLNMNSSRKMSKGRKVKYVIEKIDGEEYFRLSLRDAFEFITKKDYIDNWRSELNEEFGFWAFSDWKRELEKIGFNLLEDEDESHAYVNDWIVKNRFKDKVELFEKKGRTLVKIDYPVTNVVLVAEK